MVDEMSSETWTASQRWLAQRNPLFADVWVTGSSVPFDGVGSRAEREILQAVANRGEDLISVRPVCVKHRLASAELVAIVVAAHRRHSGLDATFEIVHRVTLLFSAELVV